MPAEIESMMWYAIAHGTVLVRSLEMQTSEDALVKAGLNWEVEKKKLSSAGTRTIPAPSWRSMAISPS